MVIISVSLAAVGIALAFQQAYSLSARLMNEAEFKASKIVTRARKDFEDRVTKALHQLADHCSRKSIAEWSKPYAWPGWLDGAYAWDLSGFHVMQDPASDSAAMRRVVAARLNLRAMDSSDLTKLGRIEMIYDSIGHTPVVLACLDSMDRNGRWVHVATRVDLKRLKSEMIDPLVAEADGLEVVDGRAASKRVSAMTWAQTMSGPMRFWTIIPTHEFWIKQRNTVVGQTLAYVGITLVALGTLLVTMWYLMRVAKRDMALAHMKADFVANVSHELKTPLAVIRMFGETLESGRVTSEEKRQEYYSVIARESAKLTHLIENILDFARINAGKQEYTLEPVDVGQIVGETFESYRLHLEAKQFEHSVNIQKNLPAVLADGEAISQAIVNLISNAIKYSDDERHLAIEVAPDTRRGRSGVLISVHDRGIGIAPEDRKRLFEGFFRASDARVQQRTGTGLGLALLKHVVDAHGGSLQVESRLVKGTTFRIFLPAATETTGVDKNTRPRKSEDDAAATPEARAGR